MVIPNLFYALAVEQGFGILLDILLPILLLEKAIKGEDAQVRAFYRLPAIAHTVHLLGTIIPLILAIAFINNPSIFTDVILEAMINLAVPVSNGLYCMWG